MAACAAFCLRAGRPAHAVTLWLKTLMRQLAQPGARLPPRVRATFKLATAMLAAQGQLPPADALAAAERALPLLREQRDRRRLLYALYLWGTLHLRHGQPALTQQAITEKGSLQEPGASLHEQRLLPWLEAMLARDQGDVARYGAFWASLFAESRERGDRIETWKATWGLAQSNFLDGRRDAAINLLDEAVDDMRADGRLQVNSLMAGQAVLMRLGHDASPATVQRLREVVLGLALSAQPAGRHAAVSRHDPAGGRRHAVGPPGPGALRLPSSRASVGGRKVQKWVSENRPRRIAQERFSRCCQGVKDP